MSVNNFIPQVWSANALVNLRKAHVFGKVANREYEGDIREAGDSVRVPMIAALTAATYTKNSTTITPATLKAAASVINVDQSKYVSFEVDDVDLRQAKGNLLPLGMGEAAYALADTADSYMAGLYADCGIAQNTNSSPVDMTSANVEEEILGVAEQMDEAGVPRMGRFGIIAPWVHTKLLLAGISNLSDNVDEWVNGYIGAALGFKLYVSANVSKNSTSWDITRNIFGIESKSYTLAEQIVKTEAFRPESSFHDAVKLLHLYGAKIIRPDMTACLYADKTAEA